jgi:hypothetical protein
VCPQKAGKVSYLVAVELLGIRRCWMLGIVVAFEQEGRFDIRKDWFLLNIGRLKSRGFLYKTFYGAADLIICLRDCLQLKANPFNSRAVPMHLPPISWGCG